MKCENTNSGEMGCTHREHSNILCPKKSKSSFRSNIQALSVQITPYFFDKLSSLQTQAMWDAFIADIQTNFLDKL